MQDAAELLHKINWFLKPVKDLLLFLFATKTGIIILLLLLLAYLIYATGKQLRYKRLLLEAARRRPTFTLGQVIGTFFEQVGKLFVALITNATVVLVVLLLLIGLLGISTAVNAVDNFVQNQQKIQDLKTVVKNLSQDYEVAKIKIKNYDYRKNETTFDVYFYDYAKKKYLPEKQTITIKGSKIYFLSLLINFEYSQIETGQNVNLALPLKVYSDVVPDRQAIELNVFDSTGIPYIYHRTEEQLYGIDSSRYAQLIKEIGTYIHDEKAARKAGVRSIHGAAPYNIRYPRPGQVYVIKVQQTGGMTLEREEAF